MVRFRHYEPRDDLFAGDFLLVRSFLIALDIPTYSFGWWDHQMTRPSFHRENLGKFGLWFDGERLVALACIDETLGNGILCAGEEAHFLLEEMIAYAKENLNDQGRLSLLIPDGDRAYQAAAAGAGLRPTQERETDSIIQIDSVHLSYALPEGMAIASLTDRYDAAQIERIMRRGFSGNREERQLTMAEAEAIDRQFRRPFANLDLHIAAIAPDGTYAAFCGLWQTRQTPTAFVEPVVTDPVYQKMGLGRAVVYEALKRCGKLGAKAAVVFSSIPFYASLGFRPNSTSTYWELDSK